MKNRQFFVGFCFFSMVSCHQGKSNQVVSDLKIKIMAGGRNPEAKLENTVNDYWIGVDRGVGYLLDRGIAPQRIFGDFDSIDAKHHTFVQSVQQKEVYATQKDETDLELALDWAIRQDPKEIHIYGATGHRLDHELATFGLLYDLVMHTTQIFIKDEQNEMFFLLAGCHKLARDERFRYISFLPYSEMVEALTLEGFQYPLQQRHIKKGRSLTVSNEFCKNVGTISFQKGILLVIKSTDSKLDVLL